MLLTRVEGHGHQSQCPEGWVELAEDEKDGAEERAARKSWMLRRGKNEGTRGPESQISSAPPLRRPLPADVGAPLLLAVQQADILQPKRIKHGFFFFFSCMQC